MNRSVFTSSIFERGRGLFTGEARQAPHQPKNPVEAKEIEAAELAALKNFADLVASFVQRLGAATVPMTFFLLEKAEGCEACADDRTIIDRLVGRSGLHAALTGGRHLILFVGREQKLVADVFKGAPPPGMTLRAQEVWSDVVIDPLDLIRRLIGPGSAPTAAV